MSIPFINEPVTEGIWQRERCQAPPSASMSRISSAVNEK